MAKFIYKMQNILNLKEKLEEQAKTAFGLARRKVIEEELKLTQMEEQKEDYQLQIREGLDGQLNVQKLILLQQAVEMMKERIKLQKIRIIDAKHQQEQARLRLTQAVMERKTQEKLRENAFEEFKQELNQQEKKEVDELVSYKYSQQAGTG